MNDEDMEFVKSLDKEQLAEIMKIENTLLIIQAEHWEKEGREWKEKEGLI